MTLLGSQVSLIPAQAVTSLSTSFQILVDETPEKRAHKTFADAFTLEVDVTVVLAAWTKLTPTPIGNLYMLYLNFTHDL